MKLGFLLMHRFSHLSLASLTEPLRIANRLSGQTLYTWKIFTEDDGPARASDGIQIAPDARLDELVDSVDCIIVVAGLTPHKSFSSVIRSVIKRGWRRGKIMGSTSTGALFLCDSGVLDGRSCCVHWEYQYALQNQYSRVTVRADLFEITDRVWTCSGGAAGLDMMLEVIRRHYGDALANPVSEQCIHPDVRGAHGTQTRSPARRLGVHHPRLLGAIQTMEKNLSQPLSLEDIASRALISRRQLERLFKEYLGVTPVGYYRKLRLDQARLLLRETSMEVGQVSEQCGFGTPSYFARCYLQEFGTHPSADRI